MVHSEENAWCRKQVKEGTKAIEKAKKDGKWKEVLEIRDRLYEAQTLWTWGRMKGQVERFKLPQDRKQRVYKLAKLHN